MNRKGAKEQNDISRIIGNLPKRLQRKIAEETGADYTVGDIPKANNLQPDVAVKQDSLSCQAAGEQRSDVASIDMFLKMTTQCSETAKPNDDAPIPGILRIQKKDKNGHNPLATPTKRQDQITAFNPRTHPAWFEHIFVKELVYAKPLPLLHDFVTDLLKRKVIIENWESFLGFRKQIKTIFLQLLLNQLKFCCEQNVESYFWKLLYYNVIEYFKTNSGSNQGLNESKSVALMDDGIEFYTILLENLNRKYLRSPDDDEPTHKYEFIAKVSAQKFLICLGDLSRYKTKISNSCDYTEACNFYQQAQSLIPSNGIPYNQLAILAIYSRKKLDAIYYHMRSLMSSNAIQSARESLKVLFDEIRKKYEENNKSPLFGTPERKVDKEPKSLRKEVWVYPDGVRRLHKTDVGNKNVESEEKRLCDLSGDEVVKRFTSTYLYIIGKLFSGIGFENFQENVKKIMVQLKVILSRSSPLIITRHRLLKIAALNIFVITHNKSNDSRKEIFNHAFNVSNQVFGLIIKFANRRLLQYKDDSDADGRVDDESIRDINSLLQYIKIWCDWLSINEDLWSLFQNYREQELDLWFEFEELVAVLESISTKENVHINGEKTAPLEEDLFLNGFVPLPLVDHQICDSNRCAKEKEQFAVRTTKIVDFGKPFLEYGRKLGKTNASTDSTHNPKNDKVSTFEEFEKSDENENTENIVRTVSLSNISISEKDMGDILQLSKLKKELEAKTNITKKYNEKLEEILKFVDTKLYIEVRPKYLLPDTNCFIDYLDDFETLLNKFKKYTLVVPLTVVKELDGLSKGVKVENSQVKKSRIHHFDEVSTRAKKSLEFIKAANNNVKYATTKGSIINASLFALVEEQQASNDDKILATALALSKSMSTEVNRDGKTFIQTELVLITTDRNLRVKALARKLAVSELKEFLQWANDCIVQV